MKNVHKSEKEINKFLHKQEKTQVKELKKKIEHMEKVSDVKFLKKKK